MLAPGFGLDDDVDDVNTDEVAARAEARSRSTSSARRLASGLLKVSQTSGRRWLDRSCLDRPSLFEGKEGWACLVRSCVAADAETPLEEAAATPGMDAADELE